jgi:propanol-preferring alcohol dehydrogenase
MAESAVLVRIETSRLCHTDIHAAHWDWPVMPTLPLVPGYEGGRQGARARTRGARL